MTNHLPIDSDDVVVNVIVVDDVALEINDAMTPYVAPDGYRIEPAIGEVWIGWRRIDGAWQPPHDDNI